MTKSETCLLQLTCTHQEQALDSGTPIFNILWLPFEQVGHHLSQKWSVPFSIEDTEIKDLRHIKEISIIYDTTMDLWTQKMFLEKSKRTNVITHRNHDASDKRGNRIKRKKRERVRDRGGIYSRDLQKECLWAVDLTSGSNRCMGGHYY